MRRQDMRGGQDDGDDDGQQVRYGQFDMVDVDILNAKAIHLVDDEGNIRALLGCKGSTVAFSLRDRSGFTRLSLNIGDGTVFVNILGEDEVSRLSILQRDRSPAVLAVHDANGQARAGLHLVYEGEHAGGGALTFQGPDGKALAVVAAHTLLGESDITPG